MPGYQLDLVLSDWSWGMDYDYSILTSYLCTFRCAKLAVGTKRRLDAASLDGRYGLCL
jgi:hypothetical protein